MKMPVALYQELEADVKAIVAHIYKKPEQKERGIQKSDMWNIFHKIMFDRMNDNEHPAFTRNPDSRILPFWSKNGETRDMQGNDHWLNRFYKEADLNDSHIDTALKRIHSHLT